MFNGFFPHPLLLLLSWASTVQPKHRHWWYRITSRFQGIESTFCYMGNMYITCTLLWLWFRVVNTLEGKWATETDFISCQLFVCSFSCSLRKLYVDCLLYAVCSFVCFFLWRLGVCYRTPNKLMQDLAESSMTPWLWHPAYPRKPARFSLQRTVMKGWGRASNR